MSPSGKGSIFISLWNVHQMSGRNVCPPGWLIQAVVDPRVPLPVIWKRSPIKNWPFLWHIQDTICQRQGTIGIFGKWGKQSFRENKAILYLYENIQNSLIRHFLGPVSLSNLSHLVSYYRISQIWVRHVSTSWFMSHLSITYSFKPSYFYLNKWFKICITTIDEISLLLCTDVKQMIYFFKYINISWIS